MQTNLRCTFRDGRGLFLVSRCHPAALWPRGAGRRCLKPQSGTAEAPPEASFALLAVGDGDGDGSPFPDRVWVPSLARLREGAFTTHPSVAVWVVHSVFTGSSSFPRVPEGKKVLFYGDVGLCSALSPPCSSGTSRAGRRGSAVPAASEASASAQAAARVARWPRAEAAEAGSTRLEPGGEARRGGKLAARYTPGAQRPPPPRSSPWRREPGSLRHRREWVR